MGLSQAVVSEITFKNGRSQQDNFHQFEIVRTNVAPKRIVVYVIPSDSYDSRIEAAIAASMRMQCPDS